MDLHNELNRLHDALAKEFPEGSPRHEADLVVMNVQDRERVPRRVLVQARAAEVLAFAQSIGVELSPWQEEALPKLIEAQLKQNDPTTPTATQQGIVNAAEAKRLRKMERNKVLNK